MKECNCYETLVTGDTVTTIHDADCDVIHKHISELREASRCPGCEKVVIGAHFCPGPDGENIVHKISND